MGKKPVRKPQKKLPQSVFLEVGKIKDFDEFSLLCVFLIRNIAHLLCFIEDGHGKPESPDGIILPTAREDRL